MTVVLPLLPSLAELVIEANWIVLIAVFPKRRSANGKGYDDFLFYITQYNLDGGIRDQISFIGLAVRLCTCGLAQVSPMLMFKKSVL
ncbi:MAG: hypothetical protein EBX71_09635 [Betaproteobacteria bacterium]|nr:hypothetical protein [Betaproteobacteria bacterium]